MTILEYLNYMLKITLKCLPGKFKVLDNLRTELKVLQKTNSFNVLSTNY